MTRLSKWRLVVAALFLTVSLIITISYYREMNPGPAKHLRTVELSMRDYTFNGANPTFTFRAGDRVRFVVRNDEQTPIRHNFAIPDLRIPCDREMEPGEIRHVILTLERPGSYEYLCCTHRGMGGRLIVTR